MHRPNSPNNRAYKAGSKRRELAFLKGGMGLIDRMADRLLPYDPLQQQAPDQRARPTILLGIGLMVVLFGIIGSWSVFWPLAAGAIAPGRVMAESNRKEIQHLEGGIIAEILVAEGSKVTAGQTLLRMDATSAEARQDQVRGQLLAAKATEARLIAERDSLKEIPFPQDYLSQEASNPKVKEALESQRKLFITRARAVQGQIDVLNQKIAQSGDEVRGLNDQIASSNAQIGLLGQEIQTVETLVKSGNATRPRLLSLQRQQADLMGQRGQAMAMVSRANQSVSEAKVQILNTQNEFINQVAAELKEVQVQISGLEEQARATGDVARRVEIAAPIEGTVTGLAVHTVGGVVQPGETLMYLVPRNDKLIVEARVNPQDVDVVHAGLKAQVRLTAFKSRYLRPAEGTVITISADRFDDAASGQSYYLARIEIPPQELAALGENVTLTSGMPADVLIVTGSRTMFSYIMRPIRESFGHAFHDQ